MATKDFILSHGKKKSSSQEKRERDHTLLSEVCTYPIPPVTFITGHTLKEFSQSIK